MMAANSVTSDARLGGAIREIASANSKVKTTSGRMSVLAAAETMFSGTSPRKKASTLPLAACMWTGCAVLIALLRAAIDEWESGTTFSRRSISAIPTTAESVERMTIHTTARPAIRPPLAAWALSAIPVMRSPTMSGTTVIVSAFSQRPPTIDAVSVSPDCSGDPSLGASMPRNRPATSAERTSHGLGPRICGEETASVFSLNAAS